MLIEWMNEQTLVLKEIDLKNVMERKVYKLNILMGDFKSE